MIAICFGIYLSFTMSSMLCVHGLRVIHNQHFEPTLLSSNVRPILYLPAYRRLLFPLLHAEKGRLRNAVANRVAASRWQGILFRLNCEIICG